MSVAAAAPPSDDSQVTGLKTVPSAELFNGQSEVIILHKGEQYRLRITRQDKLILTK